MDHGVEGNSGFCTVQLPAAIIKNI